MTVEEAIAKFKRTSVLWESASNTEMVEAVKVAITALEEIQQYREYREIFESHFTEDALKLFSDKEEFSKWFERGKWHVLKCDELGREVEKYRAIGTVSEFRELKERSDRMKDEECVYYLDSSKCDSDDCHGCVARLKENKRKYHDKEIRAKAIEEFAKTLKEKCKRNFMAFDYQSVSVWEINRIAEELKKNSNETQTEVKGE